MNMQIALVRSTHWRPRTPWPWRLVFLLMFWLGFAALAAWWLPATTKNQAAMSVSPLVHWKDASHDWLLVVDQATSELVVYDALDGRPLRRVGAASGMGPIDSVIGEGDRVVIRSKQRPGLQVLSLPQLQPVTLAGD